MEAPDMMSLEGLDVLDQLEKRAVALRELLTANPTATQTFTPVAIEMTADLLEAAASEIRQFRSKTER